MYLQLVGFSMEYIAVFHHLTEYLWSKYSKTHNLSKSEV